MAVVFIGFLQVWVLLLSGLIGLSVESSRSQCGTRFLLGNTSAIHICGVPLCSGKPNSIYLINNIFCLETVDTKEIYFMILVCNRIVK